MPLSGRPTMLYASNRREGGFSGPMVLGCVFAGQRAARRQAAGHPIRTGVAAARSRGPLVQVWVEVAGRQESILRFEGRIADDSDKCRPAIEHWWVTFTQQ